MAFLSPLGSPIRGSAYRNRTANRARGRATGGQWSPALIASLRYWLDPTGISDAMTSWAPAYDSVAAGAATLGTTTAKPVALGWTGTSRVYLPGTAGNSVSCTAPATAVSYSATPYGGGAATTGAATGGAAFAFSTAGSWESIALLNGSDATVAEFRAGDSSQSGVTDSYLVAWSVNRSSSLAKSVVQSPAAGSAHGALMFDGGDQIAVPATGLPPLRSASGSVFIGLRQHSTPANNGRYLYSNNSNLLIMSSGTTLAGRTQFGGTAVAFGSTYTASTSQLVGAFYNQSTAALRISQGASVSSAATVASPPGSSPTSVFIGGTTSVFQDFEVFALLSFDAEIGASDLAKLVSYYGCVS